MVRDEKVEAAGELLEAVYSKAVHLFLNHFSRAGSNPLLRRDGLEAEKVAGYGGALVQPWSKDFRIGVVSYMKMLVELINLDYYERSLKVKVDDLLLKKRKEY